MELKVKSLEDGDNILLRNVCELVSSLHIVMGRDFHKLRHEQLKTSGATVQQGPGQPHSSGS